MLLSVLMLPRKLVVLNINNKDLFINFQMCCFYVHITDLLLYKCSSCILSISILFSPLKKIVIISYIIENIRCVQMNEIASNVQ